MHYVIIRLSINYQICPEKNLNLMTPMFMYVDLKNRQQCEELASLGKKT